MQCRLADEETRIFSRKMGSSLRYQINSPIQLVLASVHETTWHSVFRFSPEDPQPSSPHFPAQPLRRLG